MMKHKKSISAKETLELIEKTWADKNDIMRLACCGEVNAKKIKQELVEELDKEGYKLPSGKVPMDRLIKYLKINISYLRKVAEKDNN